MKKNYILVLLSLCAFTVNAQFVDDMEYPDGIPESSYWWSCTISTCGPQILIHYDPGTDNHVGHINDDPATGVDAFLHLGDKTSGLWGIAYYKYIPDGKVGYISLQGQPLGAEFIVGNIFFSNGVFNQGIGEIDYSTGDLSDDTIFAFPHGEWFRVVMNFDITNGIENATWQFGVNGVEVLPPGTPLMDGWGASPSALGGISFYAISEDNEVYVDDFQFVNGILELNPDLGVDENATLEFSMYPNPSDGVISIVSTSDISEVKIYSLQGVLLKQVSEISDIDISHVSSGIYFIEATSEEGKSVQKLIKK